MARTALDYKKLLRHLLPSGRAWSKSDASWLSQLLYGFAEEFARIESRAGDLLKECLTLETTECITEHEGDFGIESDALSSIEKRRSIINAKLRSVGQQYKEYFEEIAAALGLTIQVEEFIPAWVGVVVAGGQVNAQKNLFYWKILVSADGDIGGFSGGFNPEGFDSHYATDRILMDQVVALTDISYFMSEIQRLKPAHVHPLFDFYDRSFTKGFGWGYYALPWYDAVCYPGGSNYGFANGFANLRTYTGKYLVGGYSQGFRLGMDVHHGGSFNRGFASGREDGGHGFDFYAFSSGFCRWKRGFSKMH